MTVGFDPAGPQRRSRTPLVLIGVLAILLGVGGAVVFSGVFGGDEAGASEVFLSPAAEVGPDPFSATPLAPPPDPALAQPITQPAATVPPTPATPVVAQAGGEVGLYGGTMNLGGCDAQQVVNFLGANPDKAAAWVAALNADPTVLLDGGRRLTVALIGEYMATLTPVVLRQDTRVTNHGYVDGQPTVLQSTLQKGTAVLVDKLGVPRVKCYCGNPLLPPVPTAGTPRYVGPPWPDFNPVTVTVIQQNTTVINNFVLTDIKTGVQFTRPVGSNGTVDVQITVNAPPTATTAPSVTAATPTTAPAPTAPATTAPATTAPATTAAPTTSPTSAVAPTTAASQNPSHASNVAVSRDPSGDAFCAANYGPGVQGYFVDGTYTDPDGDAGVVMTADYGRGYEDASSDTTWTGDGRNGTYRMKICGTPGDTYRLVLGDRLGNGSAEQAFVVP